MRLSCLQAGNLDPILLAGFLEFLQKCYILGVFKLELEMER